MRLKCFFDGWLVDRVKHSWSSIFRLIRYILQTYKIEVYIYILYLCSTNIMRVFYFQRVGELPDYFEITLVRRLFWFWTIKLTSYRLLLRCNLIIQIFLSGIHFNIVFYVKWTEYFFVLKKRTSRKISRIRGIAWSLISSVQIIKGKSTSFGWQASQGSRGAALFLYF